MTIAAELENLIRQIVREELRGVQTGGVTPESIRIGASLSIQKLAEKAGVSKPTICRIENGATRHIKTETLQRLAKALGNQDYIRAALAQRRSA